jgi:hypothetical protein
VTRRGRAGPPSQRKGGPAASVRPSAPARSDPSPQTRPRPSGAAPNRGADLAHRTFVRCSAVAAQPMARVDARLLANQRRRDRHHVAAGGDRTDGWALTCSRRQGQVTTGARRQAEAAEGMEARRQVPALRRPARTALLARRAPTHVAHQARPYQEGRLIDVSRAQAQAGTRAQAGRCRSHGRRRVSEVLGPWSSC